MLVLLETPGTVLCEIVSLVKEGTVAVQCEFPRILHLASLLGLG